MNKLSQVSLLTLFIATAAAMSPTMAQNTNLTGAPLTVAAVATDASQFHDNYYLWSEDGFYAAALVQGRVELRADGGTFYTSNYRAPFTWTLDDSGVFTLNFDNFVEQTSYVSSVGKQVEVRNILTQIRLKRTFTETDSSQQINVEFTKSGFRRYMDGSKPDEPYSPRTETLQGTRSAAILDPAQVITSNATFVMPVRTVSTVTYDANLGLKPVKYLQSSHKIKFGAVNGNSGTATLQNIQLLSNGASTITEEEVTWSINPQTRHFTIQRSPNNITDMAIIGVTQAGIPFVFANYSADNTEYNSPFNTAFAKQKTLITAEQIAAKPIFELYQSISVSGRFWTELHPSQHGLEVTINDADNDGKFSDSEIIQNPIRWQLNNGIIEIRRYVYSPTSGKSGRCIPTSFTPEPNSECVTQTVRTWEVIDITDHKGISTAVTLSYTRNLHTTRRSGWPNQDILSFGGTVDARHHQMHAERPHPIKPLVAGVYIPDDVLRQCLQQRNPTLPTDITTLRCQGNIQNLEGIEKFTELQRLYLTGTQQAIRGLEHLTLLNNLTLLHLTDLNIGDIEFAKLANLNLNRVANNISYLSLNNIRITDASFSVLDTMAFNTLQLKGAHSGMPFSRLPNDQTLQKLASLILHGFRIPDLKNQLARLNNTSLNQLIMFDQGFTSLDGIRLPNSVKTLTLGLENMTSFDVSALNTTNLTRLVLSEIKIPDMAFVASITQPYSLFLNRVNSSDWSALTRATSLTELNIENGLQLPCSLIASIRAANPTMTLYYGGCATTATYTYEVQLDDGITMTEVSMPNQADTAKGTIRIVNGKLVFVPAANITGLVEILLSIKLSNGNTIAVSLRTVVNPAKNDKSGLPWWVILGPQAAKAQ